MTSLPYMPYVLLLLLTSIGLGGSPSNANEKSDERLEVFILAGQSNMQGQGVVDLDHPQYYNGGKGTLVWSMKHTPSKDRMKHLKDADGKWVVRNDVFVRYQTENELKKGGLSIGFTGYEGKHHMGPELQFGHVVGDHFDGPVLLIKTCWGGKSLFQDFRPPSAGGESGEYFRKMFKEIRDALARLQTEFPRLGASRCKLAGFVWMQGWNDNYHNMVRGAVKRGYVVYAPQHLFRAVCIELLLRSSGRTLRAERTFGPDRRKVAGTRPALSSRTIR